MSHLPSFHFVQNLVPFIFVKIKNRSVWILVSPLSILHAPPHLAPVSSSYMRLHRYKPPRWKTDSLFTVSAHMASFPKPFKFLVKSFRLSTGSIEASYLSAPLYFPTVKATASLQKKKLRLAAVWSCPQWFSFRTAATRSV